MKDQNSTGENNLLNNNSNNRNNRSNNPNNRRRNARRNNRGRNTQINNRNIYDEELDMLLELGSEFGNYTHEDMVNDLIRLYGGR